MRYMMLIHHDEAALAAAPQKELWAEYGAFNEALSKAGINIVMISTSEIKTAVIIDEAKLTEGANVVHEAFGDLGGAGGHRSMAKAVVKLRDWRAAGLSGADREMAEAIAQRFLAALHRDRG